ncbi:hypothetical protein [Paraburkholderia flagellata]|uniref:hypothetical protein n=1 Tax=Paraburkholderia flagellata TaxID=2883241 RepID=UPI001F488EF8|nr:hypothetical protein [Paraburkholderia flagellata]
MDKQLYANIRKFWGPNVAILDENFNPTLCVEGEEELEQDAYACLEVNDMNYIGGKNQDLDKGIKYYAGFWNRKHSLIVYKVADNVFMKIDVSDYDLGRSLQKSMMVVVVREKLKVVQNAPSKGSGMLVTR